MRKVSLFIAMSLDGFIADGDGKVDWLNGQDADGGGGDAYAAFIKNVDTVIMGWNTYHQVVTELSPGQWVYEEQTSYVVTHRDLPSTEKIRFVDGDPCQLVRELKCGPGKDIWICGGADIVRQLLRADLIDEFDISVIPTLLGSGVRLFGDIIDRLDLRLTRTQVDNGIVELVYTRRQDALR